MKHKIKTQWIILVLFLIIIVIILLCLFSSSNKLGVNNYELSLKGKNLFDNQYGLDEDTCFYLDKDMVLYESVDNKVVMCLSKLNKIDKDEVLYPNNSADNTVSILESIFQHNDSVYYADLKGHIYTFFSSCEFYLFYQKNGDCILLLKDNATNNYVWAYKLSIKESDVLSSFCSWTIDDSISSAVTARRRISSEINGEVMSESHIILEDRIADGKRRIKVLSVCCAFFYDSHNTHQTDCSVRSYVVTIAGSSIDDYSIESIESEPVNSGNNYTIESLKESCIYKAEAFYNSYWFFLNDITS